MNIKRPLSSDVSAASGAIIRGHIRQISHLATTQKMMPIMEYDSLKESRISKVELLSSSIGDGLASDN